MSRENKPSFLALAAACGLRRALRSFIRPQKPSFVAVAVIPETGLLATYAEAALHIFDSRMEEYSRDGDFNVEMVDNAGGRIKSDTLRRMYLGRRTLILLSQTSDMPDLQLAADVHCVLPSPTATHFRAAARAAGLIGLTEGDAALLASVPFKEIGMAMAGGRPLRNAMRRLQATRASKKPPGTPPGGLRVDQAGLEDLVGFGEVTHWAYNLRRDLADWKSGALGWAEVDRGALLYGPPGTGKTWLASVIASACGLHLINTSAARWQSKGHLGDYLAAMRGDFKEAVEKAPSLLFIDEFDSVGDRERDRSDNANYHRQAVNGLLECLDGADRREGVIVVGATNNVSVIDPALLRSGRLERVFRIDLPNAEERAVILAMHLRPSVVDVPRKSLDMLTEGMTGADLAKVARAAKRTARAAGRALECSDVMAALPATRTLEIGELKRIAVHEAGHALVGFKALAVAPCRVTIKSAVVVGGARQAMGETRFDGAEAETGPPAEHLDYITMLMGGIAAETVVFGDFSEGAGGPKESDLARATDLATKVECQLGLGSTFVYEMADDAAQLQKLRLGNPKVARRVDGILRRQLQLAKRLIIEDRKAFDTLVRGLLSRQTLERAELDAILSGDGTVASGTDGTGGVVCERVPARRAAPT